MVLELIRGTPAEFRKIIHQQFKNRKAVKDKYSTAPDFKNWLSRYKNQDVLRKVATIATKKHDPHLRKLAVEVLLSFKPAITVKALCDMADERAEHINEIKNVLPEVEDEANKKLRHLNPNNLKKAKEIIIGAPEEHRGIMAEFIRSADERKSIELLKNLKNVKTSEISTRSDEIGEIRKNVLGVAEENFNITPFDKKQLEEELQKIEVRILRKDPTFYDSIVDFYNDLGGFFHLKLNPVHLREAGFNIDGFMTRARNEGVDKAATTVLQKLLSVSFGPKEWETWNVYGSNLTTRDRFHKISNMVREVKVRQPLVESLKRVQKTIGSEIRYSWEEVPPHVAVTVDQILQDFTREYGLPFDGSKLKLDNIVRKIIPPIIHENIEELKNRRGDRERERNAQEVGLMVDKHIEEIQKRVHDNYFPDGKIPLEILVSTDEVIERVLRGYDLSTVPPRYSIRNKVKTVVEPLLLNKVKQYFMKNLNKEVEESIRRTHRRIADETLWKKEIPSEARVNVTDIFDFVLKSHRLTEPPSKVELDKTVKGLVVPFMLLKINKVRGKPEVKEFRRLLRKHVKKEM
jgi:hypothetical protein